MNKEQIIDEAYEDYRKTILTEFFENTKELRKWATVEGPGGYNKEEFINKCKTDTEFSEKWGLKIEERELDWKKRSKLLSKEQFYEFGFLSPFTDTIINYYLNQKNIPTKLITITYNNETIESYE
jgi:hypothetical protein